MLIRCCIPVAFCVILVSSGAVMAMDDEGFSDSSDRLLDSSLHPSEEAVALQKKAKKEQEERRAAAVVCDKAQPYRRWATIYTNKDRGHGGRPAPPLIARLDGIGSDSVFLCGRDGATIELERKTLAPACKQYVDAQEKKIVLHGKKSGTGRAGEKVNGK